MSGIHNNLSTRIHNGSLHSFGACRGKCIVASRKTRASYCWIYFIHNVLPLPRVYDANYLCRCGWNRVCCALSSRFVCRSGKIREANTNGVEMLLFLALIGLLTGPYGGGYKSGISGRGYATRYGTPDDPDDGGTPAAKRHVPRKFFDSAYPYRCASRSLPFGTIVLLKHTRPGFCIVLDRGPYGARLDGVYMVKYSKTDPGEWITDFDITPAVADEIGITMKVGRGAISYKVYTPVRKRAPNS